MVTDEEYRDLEARVERLRRELRWARLKDLLRTVAIFCALQAVWDHLERTF